MTSVPHAGAECVTLSVGGNTDHPVVINVDDRRYRMRGLKTGEMAIYDDQGMSVHLTRGGIVIRGAGKPMRLTDTSGIELDSEVHVTRGLRVDGNLNLLGSRATHNGSDIGHQHKHGGVQEGNGISGTPVAQPVNLFNGTAGHVPRDCGAWTLSPLTQKLACST